MAGRILKGGKMDSREELEARISKMVDRALNLLDRASEAEEMINKGDIFGADLFLSRFGY